MTGAAEYEQFGAYRLTHLLGKGGMASVYRALRSGPMGFAKEVAIKRLHDSLSENDKILKALINEARLGGQLKHPNIVEVYEFNKVDGKYFLAMEFVDGWTVDRVLAFAKNYDEPLPPEVVLDVFAQVCDGLHYAHTLESLDGQEVELVHRDLKPANIMVSRFGIAKLMDFGIAKAATNLFQTTVVDPEHKTTKGTPHYMSPEQVAGDPNIGQQSDIFSLGSVLFEAATGEVLFSGDNLATVLFAVVKADVSLRMELVDARVPGLGAIVQKCLSKNPTERWQSAGELGEALRLLRDRQSGNTSVQDYLYRLRSHLVGAQKALQEKSTLVEELPEFATLFGQLSGIQPVVEERAALDEAIEAAERSIREGIGGLMVDTRAPTSVGVEADEPNTRPPTESVPAKASHPDLGETRLGAGSKKRRRKRREKAEREEVSASLQTRIAISSKRSRKTATRRRTLFLVALTSLVGLVLVGVLIRTTPKEREPDGVVVTGGVPEVPRVAVPSTAADPDSKSSVRSVTVEPDRTMTVTPNRLVPTSSPNRSTLPGPSESNPSPASPSPIPATPTPSPVTPTPAAAVTVVEPPVPVKKGVLRIKRSTPWAKVLVDGSDIGKKTPLAEHRLPPGTYDIELVATENKGRVTRSIIIASGATVTLGKYDFSAESWSE